MIRLMLRWLSPALALFASIAVLLAVTSAFSGRPFGLGIYTSIQFVLNTNAAALASTLGILMAIVLLMVQLTAQRYSFNIISMFVKDPRNVSLVVVFIVTISFNLWLSATIEEHYVPEFGTLLALGLGTVCFGLLIPYFAYLFDTLTPRNLLDTLQREAVGAIRLAASGRAINAARHRAYEKVRHTGDITRTSVSLSDADVATHSVWTLYTTFAQYLAHKPALPDAWFQVEEYFFRERHSLVIKEIAESRTWFERHILEEVQVAFNNSLNRIQPVNTAVSLCCRLAGERALEFNDESALSLVVKFFNTFLRASLNARDARSGYHLLYQYELLADAALVLRPDVALEISHRIAYYGETALGMDVHWMAVAAAQDLRTLAETATRGGQPREITAQIQAELLELVREAEASESTATGLLQKAAIALGGFHLAHSEGELAHALARGLRHVEPSTLTRLALELEAVTEPQFWELTDRGVNFEYVEEGPRARLGDFLAIVAAGNGRTKKGPKRIEVAP